MGRTLTKNLRVKVLVCSAIGIGILCLSQDMQAWAQAQTADSPAAQSQATDAVKLQTSEEGDVIPTQSLWDMLLAGGRLMIPLVVCSFVLLIFTFERLLSLRKRRVIPGPFVKRFMQQLAEGKLDRSSALELCEENECHVARVFAGGCRKWGRPAVEVEQAVIDEGERVSNVLSQYLRVINGVATVSPLVGLLGTVWGMMQAFNVIAASAAMGKPELLAGGISQALVTTAAGLFVAIPALILYMFFVGRVDRLVMEIDSLGQELVNLISAEGLAERSSSKSSRTKKAA